MQKKNNFSRLPEVADLGPANNGSAPVAPLKATRQLAETYRADALSLPSAT